jgi:hypothetical protein
MVKGFLCVSKNNTDWNLRNIDDLPGGLAATRSKSFIEQFYARLNQNIDNQAATAALAAKQNIQIQLGGATAFVDLQLPTTSGLQQTYNVPKTMVNYIPFKSVGTYTSLSNFCAVKGTASLKNQYFDPLYLKGSKLKIFGIPQNDLVEVTPTFNYYEVAANGVITSKGTTEPATVAISGLACTNFAVGVYLKYKMSKEGAPTQAVFSIYYKTTETFLSSDIVSS